MSIYIRPYKDGIKFSSLIQTEFATIIHGVAILICTENEVPYIGQYVIGYLAHIFILILYTI